MTGPKPKALLRIRVKRISPVPLCDQIYDAIKHAIFEGVLAPGARLPSGRDLAAQLGIARGTVRAAYDRLSEEDLVWGAGSAGTIVKAHVPQTALARGARLDAPLAGFTRPFSSAPVPFQMGAPAYDAFPRKTWARIRARAVRADALDFTTYADPRGEPALRAQIASYLAVSRQIRCHPDQVIVTSGYRHGLLLTLMALQLQGRKAWLEDPGYPLARRALQLAGVIVEPISVDGEGLRVEDGILRAPDAAVALVTPGQQAPLGMVLSSSRRRQLLAWAASAKSWIVEDDYLGELQIDGRAAPALAAGDGAEQVVHIGSFSKTMSPALGLGYVVTPRKVTERFVEVVAVSLPAPNRTTQLAVAEFLGDGHFLRHLRQMKRLYAERRLHALQRLRASLTSVEASGLGLIARLSKTADDVELVQRARKVGLAPSALSSWYLRAESSSPGLLLSITNIRPDNIEAVCGRLASILQS